MPLSGTVTWAGAGVVGVAGEMVDEVGTGETVLGSNRIAASTSSEILTCTTMSSVVRGALSQPVMSRGWWWEWDLPGTT